MNWMIDFEDIDNLNIGGIISNYSSRKRNHPMTLLTALICKDCVLVGSDSKVEDDLGVYKQEKLCKLFKDDNLVWGGSGDGRIIDDIKTWVNSQTIDGLNTIIQNNKSIISNGVWVEKIADQLASYNGRNLKRVAEVTKQSNIEASSYTAEILIAGYLYHQPLLLTINRLGVPSYDTRHNFTSSGSECNRFVGALQALMPDNFQELSLKDQVMIFAKSLDASIKKSNNADFPVQMWIAYPDKVEQILKLEDDNRPTIDRLKLFLDNLI